MHKVRYSRAVPRAKSDFSCILSTFSLVPALHTECISLHCASSGICLRYTLSVLSVVRYLSALHTECIVRRQVSVNEAAAQICMQVPALLTRRDELFPLARQVVRHSGYQYSKGHSRSVSGTKRKWSRFVSCAFRHAQLWHGGIRVKACYKSRRKTWSSGDG